MKYFFFKRRQEKENTHTVNGDFPDGPVLKNPPANAGDRGSIPGLGRFHVLFGN